MAMAVALSISSTDMGDMPKQRRNKLECECDRHRREYLRVFLALCVYVCVCISMQRWLRLRLLNLLQLDIPLLYAHLCSYASSHHGAAFSVDGVRDVLWIAHGSVGVRHSRRGVEPPLLLGGVGCGDGIPLLLLVGVVVRRGLVLEVRGVVLEV